MLGAVFAAQGMPHAANTLRNHDWCTDDMFLAVWEISRHVNLVLGGEHEVFMNNGNEESDENTTDVLAGL